MTLLTISLIPKAIFSFLDPRIALSMEIGQIMNYGFLAQSHVAWVLNVDLGIVLILYQILVEILVKEVILRIVNVLLIALQVCKFRCIYYLDLKVGQTDILFHTYARKE